MSVTGRVYGQDIFDQNQAQIGFQYQHSATTNHMYDLDPYSTEKNTVSNSGYRFWVKVDVVQVCD